MSGLRLDTLRLPVADVGPENPLPLLRPLERLERPTMPAHGSDLPEGMADRLEYGRVIGGFPYTCQDGYDRALVERDLRVAVLENARLRATFLLDYGGRLWSLRDLTTGRELLHNPGKIQLANLALRGAWFAGGVEWNLGTAAHSPFTCAPLHAAAAEGPRHEPALRLYEYERLRGVVFQLDAWLPEDGCFLKVHVRVHNPGSRAVPMWWWSNAAVAQTPDIRVVAPGDTAWYYKYDSERIQRTDLPMHEGSDVSYPGRAPDAAEYFFRPAGGVLPWVATVDAGGAGLAQVSTRVLLGRKVFRWGTGPGGRRWQDWLGDASRPYLEIQGGITETQMEHVRFPAGATWSWVEAYGPVQVNPDRAHGDWADARACVTEALSADRTLDLEADLTSASASVRRAPLRSLGRGSGWGALEGLRRESAGNRPLSDEGAPFGRDSLTDDQRPWLDLLSTSVSPVLASGDEPPVHHVKGGDWAKRLGRLEGDWLATYLRGLLAHADQDSSQARHLLEASLADRRTPWALRALAVLELEEGDAVRAADLYEAAQPLWPDSLHLAIETVETLLLAGRPSRALSVLQRIPDPGCHLGRVRMLEVRALANTGETARAAELLQAGIEVNDLREGEEWLHVLWFAVHPDVPVPETYDFRIRTDDGDLERG
jgi:hypothetical protein